MYATRSSTARRIALAAAAAAAALIAIPAAAQPYASDESGVGAVTVYGPHHYVRDPETGARVRTDDVSMVVSLADLDLSTPAGAGIARVRIERAAREVCEGVQNAYPQDVDYGAGCYARAVRDGLAQAEDLSGYPIIAWGYR